jgi:hypothetical protein
MFAGANYSINQLTMGLEGSKNAFGLISQLACLLHSVPFRSAAAVSSHDFNSILTQHSGLWSLVSNDDSKMAASSILCVFRIRK